MVSSRKGTGDFFRAHIEEEEMVMEPHCVCGNPLAEDYYCDKCRRQCSCTEIRCKDQETLDYVDQLLHNNASFRNFTSVLEEKK